ncbi:dTDP-4-dehydrorhamnose reductase [Pseudomonadota bacterium AL_CKDN230030165-1A_HGKHYDSX7]
MKVLLLGKNGQVGRELQRTLLPLGSLVAMDRTEADLAQPDTLRAVIERVAPDVIVNAAAYTAVDKAETDADTAERVNAQAVAVLADCAARRGALLVHYSTDYVFDGTKAGPYLEDDATGPQSVYGRTKLEGEQAIAQAGCASLVLRTSWVFSSHGGNFIKTMLRLARERDALRVVADQHGAPTSAELIADVTAHAILAHVQGRLGSGVYHLVASGETTWHGLATYAIERARANGMPLALPQGAVAPISTAEYPVPARRPANSRLDNTKLASGLGLALPAWQVYVDRLIDQLTSTDTP